MRRDPRTRGHPTLGPKYEAEGRDRPLDPWESPRATPLHYQTHSDQRVILAEDGSPQLHHEALEAFLRRGGAPRARSWLSAPEVARLLEVEPKTVRDWIERGELPAAQPGGAGSTYHIDIKVLDAVLASRGYTQDQLRDFRATWEVWTRDA